MASIKSSSNRVIYKGTEGRGGIKRSIKRSQDNLFKAIKDTNSKNDRIRDADDLSHMTDLQCNRDASQVATHDEPNDPTNNRKSVTESGKKIKSVNVRPLTYQKCSKGTLLLGCIEEVLDVELRVSLPNAVSGSVSALNVSDTYTRMVQKSLRDPNEHVASLRDLYCAGDLVRCEVIESPCPAGSIQLSVDPRRVNRRLPAAHLTPGVVVSASVSSVEDHGYMMDLGVGSVAAFLPRKNATKYLPDAPPVGKQLLCCIKSRSEKLVKVSLQPILLNKVEKGMESLCTVHPGTRVSVTVSKVGKGIIAQYQGLRATIHRDHMLHPHTSYTPGSQIIATVLYVDHSNKKIGLTELPHLSDPSLLRLDAFPGLRVGSLQKGVKVRTHDDERFTLATRDGIMAVAYFSDFNSTSDVDEIKQRSKKGSKFRGNVRRLSLIDNMVHIVLKTKKKSSTKSPKKEDDVTTERQESATGGVIDPKLDPKPDPKPWPKFSDRKRNLVESESSIERLGSCPFTWGETFHLPHSDVADDSSCEDDEMSQPKTKKSKKNAKNRQLEEEKELYEAERQLASGSQVPQTADAFDRLMLQSPNSSLVWLRYMAFHLEGADVDAARAVAERALKTIVYREEQEKLNVWLAYLNLENMYGSDEVLRNVLDRAVRNCDPWKVYTQLLHIFIQSDKIEEGEQLLTTMLKKYKQDKRAWIEFALFYYKNGRLQSARGLLQRALKSLDKALHIEVISKFSQLECQYGELEVGKSMFEQLLSTYPKRSDLWSVYIDIIIKAGQVNEARLIFERLAKMQLPAKKMKFFFKKWLDVETVHGTGESVDGVKQKAAEYVEKQKA